MKIVKWFLIVFCSFSVSCANLSRSSESGYADPHRLQSADFTRRSSKVATERHEDRDAENISQKTRLKQMENSLSTKKETEQYSKALPWFSTEEERIEFLRLPGFEARQRWLTEKGFSNRTAHVQNNMKDLVEAQDIAVGMPQSLVRKSWGDPDSVEVSGNPQFKNERWHYNRYISTQAGYRPEKRTIYFEGGKVVAWELN